MFGSNNRSRDNSPGSPSMPPSSSGRQNGRGMFSVLGPDVTVAGNVIATNDLHIDGRVEGDVHCSSLAQGAESQIFGSVTADSARIAGTIEGQVRVKQLTVERSARITGDVEYENITVENGAHVDGNLKYMASIEVAAPQGPQAEESAGKKAASPVAVNTHQAA